MAEYIPPDERDGTYFTVIHGSYNPETQGGKYYLLDDDSGEITRKFFGRLGNPTYNMGPEIYHDSGYNTYTENHGFTIPNSSKFRFQEPKTARFNELACPIDNQRRVHGYLLCYCTRKHDEGLNHVGSSVLIRHAGTTFGLPWGYGGLRIESQTRVALVTKEMIGEKNQTWDSSQYLNGNEEYILLQDDGLQNDGPLEPINPNSSSFNIYIFEVSDRIETEHEPTHSSTTINSTWSSLRAFSTAEQFSISPIDGYDDKAHEDLFSFSGSGYNGAFFTVHPAAASSMSRGELKDFTHLANGYFGKGIFFSKPGLDMDRHAYIDGYNIKNQGWFFSTDTLNIFGVHVLNQDAFVDSTTKVLCNVQTNGFKWVENLLSLKKNSSINGAIHDSTYLYGYSERSNLSLNIEVDTLIGEHHWWDITASSYEGAVSDNPFFRVTGTAARDGTAEKKLDIAYPALIAYSKSIRHKPFTVQIEYDNDDFGKFYRGKWKRKLRDFCVWSGTFPETLYIRFGNLALNDKTMTIIGEGTVDDPVTPSLLVVPGYDPSTQDPDQRNYAKYSMLEIDIVPMNPDIFPTALPIMWSYWAFYFFYNKASAGLEKDALYRLANDSTLDYGYEAMTVGQDFYYDDGTNAASTSYPITLTDEEYSKCYRENISRLVSTYSEWEFPSHISELPTTASDRDSTVAFGFREPSGHRIIVTNINCVTPSSP